MTRPIDMCPVCSDGVSDVSTLVADHGVAEPCGHHVLVTHWPDRVQLDTT